MNREVKFDFIYKGDNCYFHKTYTLNQLLISELRKLSDVHNQAEIVAIRQYIGRQDIKGKDIYESDLVLCEGLPSGQKGKPKRMLGKISQDTFGWTVLLWYKNEWWAYSKMNYSTLDRVGNTIENPELLEGK